MASPSNPLTQLIPALYRKYVYLVAAAALFVFGIWQATEGDWKAFAIALATALAPTLAASNTAVNQAVEQRTEFDGHSS